MKKMGRDFTERKKLCITDIFIHIAGIFECRNSIVLPSPFVDRGFMNGGFLDGKPLASRENNSFITLLLVSRERHNCICG